MWLLTGYVPLRTAALFKSPPVYKHEEIPSRMKEMENYNISRLSAAAQTGNVAMAKLSLENDDYNEEAHHQAFNSAASRGHALIVHELCKYTIANKGLLETRNAVLQNMYPYLAAAVSEGRQQVVDVFLSHQVPIYLSSGCKKSMTLFHRAGYRGDPEILQQLLTREASTLKSSPACSRIANAGKKLKDYLPNVLIAEIADYMGLGQAEEILWYQLHKRISKSKAEALFIPSLQVCDGLGRTPLASVKHALKSEKDQAKRQKLEACVGLLKGHRVNLINSLIKSDSK